jgi:hypothetical protein
MNIFKLFFPQIEELNCFIYRKSVCKWQVILPKCNSNYKEIMEHHRLLGLVEQLGDALMPHGGTILRINYSGNLDSETLILYPTTQSEMRGYFFEAGFGKDEFHYVETGKRPDPDPNTPERFAARRDAGLAIYDAMWLDFPVYLVNLFSCGAHLRTPSLHSRKQLKFKLQVQQPSS